ncbi:MAG: hypothetical protein GX861_03185 [Tenericutes bacterium]|nr:hypothetical protein [Mycoplasmatota bacterium]
MYWSYYLNLERSVLDLERYVTFDKTNFECFSIEFIKIYQVICSEIDVVLKLITNKINMEEYKKYLLKKPEYIKIKQSKVVLESNKDIKLCPFVLLEEGKNLSWWGNYNDVKL